MNYKKVLYVSPSYRRKGGIASVVSLYKEYLGSDFRHFSTIDYSNNLINVLIFPFKLLYFIFYLLINREIEIVHIHGSSKGSFYRKYIIFLICKNIFNKKVIYHMHASSFHVFLDGSNRLVLFFVSFMMKNVDLLVVLSKWWKNYFNDKFNINHIEIINNITPEINLPKKEFNSIPHVLFLGRIDDRKGIFDVVRSVIRNQEFFRNKIKIIVGGDGRVLDLKKMIQEHDIADLIEFVGWVSGEQKMELLQRSDILILTSFNEGLPISLLEGLSCKMPLISTYVGGISEILEHKKNGYVVEPGNEIQISEALRYYIENKDLIKKHGEESYRIANRYFPKTVFSQLESIYSKLEE